MSRRVSLPERALSTEDTGLEPVVGSARAKSGSVSSDDGDPSKPKQSTFFKNLSRSLDPAAAPPKKKDYLEEYQKYKAKRAFHLHGVVKQQTIDLGMLGVSNPTSSSESAQSRRFSTGTNPPQANLTAATGAKSATLPASRGQRGPPPPVAPRKKSVNLPPIAEPTQAKLPSPVHEAPSYILSAAKKEQQRAEVEKQKAALEAQKTKALNESPKEESKEGESCSENEIPAETAVQGFPGEDTTVGVHVTEGQIIQEADSVAEEQGGSTGGQEESLASIQETEEVEKEESNGATTTDKKEESLDGDSTDIQKGDATKDVSSASASDIPEQETKEVGQNDTVSTVGEEAEVKEGSEVSQSNVKEEESILAENVAVEQIASSEAPEVETTATDNDITVPSKVNSHTEATVEGSADKEGKTEDIVHADEVKEESVMQNENDDAMKNDLAKDMSGRPEDEVSNDASSVPKIVFEVVSDAPVEGINIDASILSEQKGTNLKDELSKESKEDSESGKDVVVNSEKEETTFDSESGKDDVVKSEDKQTMLNGDSSVPEPSSTDSTPTEEAGHGEVAKEKLSKTADLLLSFSQDKEKGLDPVDTDLAGISDELKKLNTSIGELSSKKEVKDTASEEDQEKLKEIEAMRQEMESMRQEMELFG